MCRAYTIAIALAFLAALPAAAKERVWTDSAGRTMRAEFVRELDGDVTFLRGGKLVTIPLDKLSPADQQIVRDLAAGKPLPEEAPATPQAGEFGSDAPSSLPGNDNSPAPQEKPAAASDSEQPLIRKPIPIENRTWTDIHGNQTTARYVRILGANVVLARGGRSVTVKYHELIEADQQYLRDLLTSHGQEAMIPPKVSAQDLSGPAAPADPTTDPIDATTPSGVVPAALAPPPGTVTGNALPPTSASPPAIDATIPPPATAATTSFDPALGPSAVPPSAPSNVPAALPPAVLPPTTGSDLPGYAPTAASTALAASGRTSGPSYQPSYSPESSPSYSYAEPVTEMPDRSRGPRVYSSPTPAPPSFHEETIGACSSCGREITRAQSTANNCPYCGVRWTYKQNQAAGQAMPRIGLDGPTASIIAVVLGALVALVVVVCVIVGVIYALMGMATAPSTNRDRPYMR